VLPFENVGGSAETEHLSDGVTEALINDLSRLSNPRVVARSTAFGFKGRGLRIPRRAYDEHNDYLIYLNVEPLFDPLRGDPRFQELLRKVRPPQ
jgi:TolB-like protein